MISIHSKCLQHKADTHKFPCMHFKAVLPHLYCQSCVTMMELAGRVCIARLCSAFFTKNCRYSPAARSISCSRPTSIPLYSAGGGAAWLTGAVETAVPQQLQLWSGIDITEWPLSVNKPQQAGLLSGPSSQIYHLRPHQTTRQEASLLSSCNILLMTHYSDC